MSQPKLTLRPPPHREFIQGFPGIVGAGPRPPAHVAGTVEVRLGTKGLKAAWLRIELRKLETLPGGESWGELIGKGPIDVWSARKDEAYKSESEKGWELLQTADFPFQVSIPEGLPPSAKLEKNAGVNYELVTSLCVRSKKGLLKKETTSSIIQNTHPLWLDKHELHSTWSVYSQPQDLEAIQDDIRVKVMRNRSCYGPGDSVDVRVIVSSERVSPIKVKSISFSIRETITFKGSAKKTFGSNKAASQKSETLSSKSKSFGKKVYKGDIHTFDLSCQIPRTHTLMTIQTAKHIEVSYTLRVQVETAKKPIIVDHLPITVSNFTKTASDALMDRIGWVPGLSAPVDAATAFAYQNDRGFEPAEGSAGGQPTITRSMSFGGSTYSGGRSSYPGYPGGDLRRRDTVMTQGTAISGPGMAGRGVPGQVFSWGQYGAAQPFGGGEAPRPAFAGPPSIYEGRELAPEETRALFHSTNRPQSAMVLGTAVDPVLMPPSSYQGHSGAVTPIAEGSEDGHGQSQLGQRASYPQQQQQDPRRHSQYSGTASPASFTHHNQQRYSASGAVSNVPVVPAEHRYTGTSPAAEVPYRNTAGTPDLSNGATTRYVRPEPVHQHPQASPARTPAPDSGMTSAEAEKQRLYERARQQAERNQRRADERRALHQGVSTPASPVGNGNGGRPYSMMNLASYSSAAQSSVGTGRDAGGSGNWNAVAHLSAEAEKMRLFERARAEAERYQSGYQQGAAFPPSTQDSTPSAAAAAAAVAGGSGSGAGRAQAASSTMVSGRSAPYPSYMTAEEEKRQLYEKAKAEAEAFQRGEPVPSSITPGEQSSGGMGHRQAASLSNGTVTDIPGAWPKAAPTVTLAPTAQPHQPQPIAGGSSSSTAPAPSTTAGPGAAREKEQLRRYYEARDAVAQHLSQSSFSQPVSTNEEMYASEVASAVHGATPHQPADTVASPICTSAALVGPTAVRPGGMGVQSYLTEAEQQSAEEKERLASHYARKTARAEARAVAKTSAPARAGGVGAAANGASEKAQLAAYYAARDAMEQNLGSQSQPRVQTTCSVHTTTTASNTYTSAIAGGSHSSATQPIIAQIRASSGILLPPNSSFAHQHSYSVGGAGDQWKPEYNSLYHHSHFDQDVDRRTLNATSGSMSRAAPPPPLPPKIPIRSSFAPVSYEQAEPTLKPNPLESQLPVARSLLVSIPQTLPPSDPS
ncbi:hypothetical protein NDA13_006361 [Ustilago tritici]|nr:hypothetical protein NDA13_006361 [Ustilago tritici]